MKNNERLAYAMKLFGETVTIDENMRSGVPCLKGHRISIGRILAEVFQYNSRGVHLVAHQYDLDEEQINKLLEFLTIFFDCKGVGIWTDETYSLE
jgi:uncharacterized protein (DUF433 family)